MNIVVVHPVGLKYYLSSRRAGVPDGATPLGSGVYYLYLNLLMLPLPPEAVDSRALKEREDHNDEDDALGNSVFDERTIHLPVVSGGSWWVFFDPLFADLFHLAWRVAFLMPWVEDQVTKVLERNVADPEGAKN